MLYLSEPLLHGASLHCLKYMEVWCMVQGFPVFGLTWFQRSGGCACRHVHQLSRGQTGRLFEAQ